MGLFFFLCLGTCLALEFQEEKSNPREIILKAIDAHGGMKKLSTHRADKTKTKGKIQFAGLEAEFEGNLTVRLPDQLKSVHKMMIKGEVVTLVQVYSQGKISHLINGQPLKVEGPVAVQIQETMRLARLIRLLPLLNDKGLELTRLGDVKAGEKTLRVVKISEKGKGDVAFLFDSQTGFLVKTEMERDFEGKKVLQEDYFFDFRNLGGFIRPVKIQTHRGGKKILDAEMVEVRYFESLPDTEFAP
ncbi:MAG: hypothetical protein EXR99_01125 [Gemmataceae bacterium]|nr:hypothetical protein [Gemmataceae bacterium]